MASSGILGGVNLVRTDVADESIASIFRATRIGDRSMLRLLVSANAVPGSSIVVTMMMEAILFSKTSGLTTVTRSNIPEDGILHSHRREKLKSYIALTGWPL
jgi:hypothetical protein